MTVRLAPAGDVAQPLEASPEVAEEPEAEAILMAHAVVSPEVEVVLGLRTHDCGFYLYVQ